MKRLVILLVLAGCASKPVRPPIDITPKDFWDDQARRAPIVDKLSGKLTLHYESEKESLSGKGRVISDLKGDLRVELRDPFGRLHYDAALNGERFVAFYPRQKVAYLDGTSGKTYLKEVVGIPLSFSEVQSLWVGVLPKGLVKQEQELKDWEWNFEKGQFEGVGKDSAGNKVLIGIDAETKALKELQFGVKEQTVSVQYSDYDSCCGKPEQVAVARVVAIQLLQGSHQSIEVEWNDLNDLKQSSPDQFKIALPEGIRAVKMN